MSSVCFLIKSIKDTKQPLTQLYYAQVPFSTKTITLLPCHFLSPPKQDPDGVSHSVSHCQAAPRRDIIRIKPADPLLKPLPALSLLIHGMDIYPDAAAFQFLPYLAVPPERVENSMKQKSGIPLSGFPLFPYNNIYSITKTSANL